MSLTARQILTTPLALLACVGIGACGGGVSDGSRRASAGDAPTGAAATADRSRTVVAAVQGKPITEGQLRHAMASAGVSRQEVPEPPHYAACIEQARTGAGSTKATAQLERDCQARYRTLLVPALNSLIHARWLIGEAAEEGLKLDQAALSREYASAARQPQSQSALARSGRSFADLKSGLMLAQLSDRIYEGIERRTPRVTPARVSSFYDMHRRSFRLPERRDLRIVRTASDAAAKGVRRQIEAGRSFASVVRQIKLPQPVFTKEAFLPGLVPHSFSEKVLNDAIFKAPTGALEGPVRISLGYYVFKVTRVRHPRQQTLAEVRSAIERQLPEQLHKQVLARFVKAFRAKWRARSDCRPGYVVEDCRQYQGSGIAADRDPYTF